MKTTNNYSLLIVDDDDDYRMALRMALESQVDHVFEAESGLEAIEVLEKTNLNLILTDISMPKMDGPQLLKYIKNQVHNPPPIIVITGYNDLSTEEVYDLGAAAVICKPFERNYLKKCSEFLMKMAAEPWIKRPPRYPSTHKINIEVLPDQRHISTHMFNVGRGGAFVAATNDIPAEGSQVNFSFQFSESDPFIIRGVGQIRWIRNEPQQNSTVPSGYGIEFLFIEEPGRFRLKHFLDLQSGSQYIPSPH